MASVLRQKFTVKYPRFSSPPSWVSSNDLGYVSERTPGDLMNRLGIGSFIGSGNDVIQDVANYLDAAFKTSILSGLFMDVIQRKNAVEFTASSDMYGSSSGGAIMLKFIKALLADADKAGRIAMPGKTYVDTTSDGKRVIVSFVL